MRDYYGQPAFRRLLVWLNANDGSGYGCIELNTFSDTADFVNQLSKSCEKAVVEINYSRIRPDKNSELIVDGQQYLTIENFRRKYGDEAILVITHLDDIIDDMDDGETKALVNEINMNRENYVNYPSQILFVFRKAFMDKVFESAFDFTSMMGFHEDLTHLSSSSIRLKNSIESYRPMPNREMLDIYRDDFLNEDIPINERMEAAKKYIDVCTYFYIIDENSLDTIKSILSKFPNLRGRNKRIEELEGEAYRLICSNPQIAKYYSDRIKEYKDRNMLSTYEISESLAFDEHLNTVYGWKSETVHSSNKTRLGVTFHRSINEKFTSLKDSIKKERTVLVNSDEPLVINHVLTAEQYISVGLFRKNQGDYGVALDCFKKALTIQEEELGRNHPDTAETHCLIGLTYRSQGDHGNTIKYLEKAVAIREKMYGRWNADIADSDIPHRYIWTRDKDLWDSQSLKRQVAIERARQKIILDPVLGHTYRIRNTVDDEIFIKFFFEDFFRLVTRKEHLLTAMIYNNIGLLYREQRDYVKALDNLKKVLEIFQQVFSFDHPYTRNTQRIVMDLEACMLLDTHTKMRYLTLPQLMLPMKQ